ncbi:MAG: PAS domain-containing protein [Spirochaetota bacterium]
MPAYQMSGRVITVHREPCILAVAKDSSDKAEREASILGRRVIENVNEGIVVYDTSLRCKVWNPFMENMTGLRAGEVIGVGDQHQFSFEGRCGRRDRGHRDGAGHHGAEKGNRCS